MVQALAFAELLAGGILFLAGWKGYTPAEVVKGEAGSPKPLASSASSSSPSSSTAAAGGPEPKVNAAGLANPLGAARGVVVGRTDQGVDYSATPGSPVSAVGAGTIDAIIPNWYQGQPLIEEHLASGNHPYIYYAEQLRPNVKVGQKVKGGQRIATVASSGTGLELGLGAGGGRTLAQATTGYTEGQETTAGKAWRRLAEALGLK